MKVTIEKKDNSFIINNNQIEPGKLVIYGDAFPLIQIGGYETTLAEINADGETFSTLQDLQNWADTNMF